MRKMVMVMILALCMPWAGVVFGGTTPLQVSIWSPVQVFPEDYDVAGIRCGIYSRNRHVYGLDVGVQNRADASSGGIQVGLLFSAVSGMGVDFLFPSLIIEAAGPNWDNIDKICVNGKCASYTGLQISYISNYADEIRGVQVAFVENGAVGLRGCQFSCVNECSSGGGWQMGVLNEARRDFCGLQGFALFNFSKADMSGLQLGGLWNLCEGDVHGLQIGLLNMAGKMTGVQVGLVNVIKDSSVPFLPLINMKF